jgi:hypothetical protein
VVKSRRRPLASPDGDIWLYLAIVCFADSALVTLVGDGVCWRAVRP